MLGDLKRFRKISGLAFAVIVVLSLLIQPAVAYGANSLSPFRQITHSFFCSFAGLFNPAACNVPEEQLPPSAIDAPEASAASTDDPLPFRAADTELPETNELPNPNIIQPVVERTMHTREIVRESGITQEQFDIALNELRKQISSAQAALPASYGAPVAPSIPNTWGLTQRIDQLSGVDFSDGTITGTPITNSPISGSMGSFTTLTVSGQVGIGTTTPAYALDIVGSAPRAQVRGTANGSNVGWKLAGNSADGTRRDSGLYFNPGNTDASTFLSLSADNATHALVATRENNVGIGTTAPDSIDTTQTASTNRTFLSVNDSDNNAYLTLSTGAAVADGSVTSGIQFGATGETSGHGIKADILNFVDGATAGQEGGVLAFRTKPNGTSALSERMRIDEAGNVGIGTTAPGDKLEVAGNVFATGLTVTGGPTRYNSTGGLFVAGNAGSSYGEIRAYSDNLGTGKNLSLQPTAGNVGIGTTAPGAKLHLNDSGNGTILQASRSGTDVFALNINADNSWTMFDGVGASWNAGITQQNGNIGIGTTTPADKLDVAGDIRVGTGTTGCVKDADGTTIAGTCSSDERLKTDIAVLPDILDNLVELRPVSYHWNETAADLFSYGTSSPQIGLIAQDVELHLPALVTEDAEGYKQIRFSDLPIYLLKGMREMWAIVSSNRSDIATLKSEVAALKVQLAASSNFERDADAKNDNSPTPEPTIQLRGNDPAQVALNANYSDLGAIAKDANGDDLSVSLLLDGEPVDAITLDTSTSSTHIITYSAVTQDDIIFEITRTVIIGEPEDTDAADPEAPEAGDETDEPNSADIESGDAEENPALQDIDPEVSLESEEAADEPASTDGGNEPVTDEETES